MNKGGRKRLGNRKREHAITLRFNGTELEKVKAILQSYNLDFGKRGTVGPFLRKLILNGKAKKDKRIPDGISNLIYQINKTGTNINQLVKVANYKNMRSPNSNLELGVQKASELMLELIETINAKNFETLKFEVVDLKAAGTDVAMKIEDGSPLILRNFE